MTFTSWLEVLQSSFDWVWRTSLETSVLIALVFLVQWLGGRRLSPRIGYVLWMLVLVRLIIPAVPASRMSIFNLRSAPITAEFQPVVSIPASTPAQPVAESGRIAAIPFTPSAAIMPPASLSSRELAPLAWLTGAVGLAGLALAFHFRTLRTLRHERPITDPRIETLMEECRAKIRLRADIPVLRAAFLHTPAVFGWWRARILLPPEMVARLETRELRMVLLHELVHIKRCDVLLNWLVILVRALHWFNPLVWLAVKRLRAERELICDRRVLALLTGDEERRCYGETLLKLMSGLSRPALNPSLVPLLTNKQTLKRRITMIARYRPASRLAAALAVALLALLCCLTFTRAASEPGSNKPKAATDSRVDTRSITSAELRQRDLKQLEQQLDKQDDRIQSYEESLNQLRRKLGVSSDVLSSIERSLSEGGGTVSSDKIRELEKAQIEVRSTMIKERSVLSQLEKLTREQLRSSIHVVYPDAVLPTLLQEHALAAIKLSGLTNDFGPMSSEVKNVRAQMGALQQKIDERIDGIIRGLEMKVRASEAQQEAFAKEVDSIRCRDIELAESVQPYLRVKRNLGSEQRFRDALALRLAQEKLDAALPRSVGASAGEAK